MRPLLTIHGIGIFGEQGPWQAPIDRVLSPHFHCVPVKYAHYRWLGFVSAVMEPKILLIGLVTLFAVRLEYKIPFLYVWLAAILLASWMAARIRHQKALEDLLTKSSRRTGYSSRPHVIAHSMGTKLLGKALEEFPHIRLGNIILAGCVLPTDYRWEQVKSENPLAFDRLRNEVGQKDLVPWIAHAGHRLRLLHGYGMAGRVGFTLMPGWVHLIDWPNFNCAHCSPDLPAPIHNVNHKHFGHGSVFKTMDFAATYWLPFLWDIEIEEYSLFLRYCLVANRHLQQNDLIGLRRVEAELLDTSWRWAEQGTLAAYITRYLSIYRAGLAVTESLVAFVLYLMYVDFSAACEAFQKTPEGWKEKVAALHPKTALMRAIQAAVD